MVVYRGKGREKTDDKTVRGLTGAGEEVPAAEQLAGSGSQQILGTA